MLVTCIDNRAADLPESLVGTHTAIQRGKIFPLTIGQSYVVYAMTTWHAHFWYYVLDDDRLWYPVWSPATLFEITDGRLPDGWCVAYYRANHGEQYPVISFPEWANDHSFYERLVDGNREANRIFTARKAEADSYHPQIGPSGQVIDH